MSFARLASIHVCVLAASLAAAQSWTQVETPPYYLGFYPGNEMLLTDGTVLMQDADNSDWWKLTPDKFGSYVNGTWTELASSPGYGPLYYASQVLPNGNVFTIGGEYNDYSSGVWQSQGYLYNTRLNTWTYIQCPPSWTAEGGYTGMGDTASLTLPNGMVLVADPIEVYINGEYQPQCAIYNPATNTFNTPFINGKADDPDEEGLTLLPDGKVLTADAWSPPNSEIFDPATMHWSSAGMIPADLSDPVTYEVGPAVLRYDGTVFYCGSQGDNCIYNTVTRKWSKAPSFPMYGGVQLACEDAPGVLLTNGHVLVQTSPGVQNEAWNYNPSVFFEWDGKKLTQEPGTLESPYDVSYQGVFLMLPTGQVIYTDQTGDCEVYNSVGGPEASWAPTIKDYPTMVRPGDSYKITGTQFNGLSGDSAYGDDEQNTTNYPLIRITNNHTKHVFYCREYDPSTMAICTGSKIVYTNFQVPYQIETGPSKIEVVTNGIPSVAKPITVN